MARMLIFAGLIITGIGLLILAGIPFGRLPLDFVYRRGNATFYFPLGTSIVLSVLLTLLLMFLRR